MSTSLFLNANRKTCTRDRINVNQKTISENMHKIIYDIREESFNYWTLLLPLVLLWILILIIAKRFQLNFTFRLFIATFHIIYLILFLYLFLERRNLVESIDTNNCLVVQGSIKDFKPKTFFGKKPESFFIDSVYFEYSDSETANGYNKTIGIGGNIKNGVKAKVFYKDGKILRFEIWE